jgi:biopolymer transport protein ExbD
MIVTRRKREGLDFSYTTINVVLLLLFFFIVTGTITTTEEVDLQPPLTETLPKARLPRPLLVMAPSGALILDGVQIEQAALGAELRIAAAHADKRPLNIVAEREMPAAILLDVARIAGEAGLEVRVVTQPVGAGG